MEPRTLHPPTLPLLSDGAKLGGWWSPVPDSDRILCELCPRACALKAGDRGFCFVRENRDGQMVLSTYGRSTGFCIDPIEKKPLNHFYPGTSVLSFGTAGCNLGCKFCQNWSISKSREVERLSEQASPEAIAQAARHWQCHSVAFTYNDPIVWAEYAIDTARACHNLGIKTVAVTAGYITGTAREAFFSVMDAANVDLKAFTEQFYQELTLSHLQPVLDTLAWLKRETNVWFEITNLVIPQANDSDDELKQLCDWVLAHVGDEVPVHFTAFHPDFRLKDRLATPLERLLRGYEIAKQTGLRYAYVGNVNDVQHQSTYCSSCGQVVIERNWYQLGDYQLEGNRCRHCGTPVAGHFDGVPGTWGRRRQPVQMADFESQFGSLSRHNSDTCSSQPQPVQISHPHHDLPAMNEPKTRSTDVSMTGSTSISSVPPMLTDAQRRVLHREACWLVSCASQGYATRYLDEALGGSADQTVLGCFVTLKRNEKLRACCGFVGRSGPLKAALYEAAVTTATADKRLPTISRVELNHLSVDVSVLHNLQPVTMTGDARREAVEVGRHGLQISMGNARGLLLPSVATENELEAEEFLEHVCIKAGLPPTSWKSPEAKLFTFEGIVFGGPMDASLLGNWDLTSKPLLDAAQIQRLASICKDNLVSHIAGAVPKYVPADIPDGQANGVMLALRMPGREAPAQFGRVSLRPGVPLHATLMELTQVAARLFQASGLSVDHAESMAVDVAVLSDPAMHGTVAEPALEGLSSEQPRAVLVAHGNRSCWLADQELSTREAINKAFVAAGIRQSSGTAVYSLAIASTTSPIQQIQIPQPLVTRAPRKPAVAGMFYPEEPAAMRQELETLFSSEVTVARQRWRAAMVPHAGWKYSGRIAAQVLQQIELPETIIVLGPKHTRFGVDWAIAPCQTWEIPGGQVAANLELASALARRLPEWQFDAAAHKQEHGIEVELPLIAHLAPHTRIVGITIGAGELEDCQRFADGLAEVLRACSEAPLLLISSDMNHFASDAETRRLDELALECLDQLDAPGLYRVVHDNHISMCGMLPAVIALETLQRLRPMERAQRVAYATTADTTGNPDRVVGYAGMLFN